MQLAETDTIWHLDMPGVSVSKDSEIAEDIRAKNEKYHEVCHFIYCLLAVNYMP